MAQFEPILNNAKLGVVAVKIYVKSIWKKLKNPNFVLGHLILVILGGSGEVWAPILGVEGLTK